MTNRATVATFGCGNTLDRRAPPVECTRQRHHAGDHRGVDPFTQQLHTWPDPPAPKETPMPDRHVTPPPAYDPMTDRMIDRDTPEPGRPRFVAQHFPAAPYDDPAALAGSAFLDAEWEAIEPTEAWQTAIETARPMSPLTTAIVGTVGAMTVFGYGVAAWGFIELVHWITSP